MPLDPQTQATIQAEQTRARQMMEREIGVLSGPIELYDDRECAAGNLLADALLERMEGAELSLVLAGHWENGLEAGPLTQGTLFTANRSTANPGRVRVTGAQILAFLRQALDPENAARQMRELRGRAVGMPHIAGASLTYGPGLEHIRLEIDGRPLEEERTYTVVSTDMEFSQYIGYLVIPFAEIEFEVPTIMPEVLEDYIKKHSPLPAPAADRLRFEAK